MICICSECQVRVFIGRIELQLIVTRDGVTERYEKLLRQHCHGGEA